MRRDEHLLSGGGGDGGGRGGKGKLNRQLYVSKVFWSYDYCITYCRNKKSNDGWLLLESEANRFFINDINLACQYVLKTLSIIPQTLIGENRSSEGFGPCQNSSII